MSIIHKLIGIANKLDQRGLYDEANKLDVFINKYAEEYEDYSPVNTPSELESDMMEMDISPDVLEKEREYQEKEVPTDPAEVEELIMRTKILLKGVEDPESSEGPGYLAPQEDLPEDKWYFDTQGLPEEEEIT